MTRFRQKQGKRGEDAVCRWLIQKGYRIVGRNLHEKFAEIDIVAAHPDGKTLSFVEVRTRANTRLGHPLETVDNKKQKLIRKAATLYLSRNNLFAVAAQFDVASIVWETEEFQYIENAF